MNQDDYLRYYRVLAALKRGELEAFRAFPTDYREFSEVAELSKADHDEVHARAEAAAKRHCALKEGSMVRVVEPFDCSDFEDLRGVILEKGRTFKVYNQHRYRVFDVPIPNSKFSLSIALDDVAFFWHFEVVE